MSSLFFILLISFVILEFLVDKWLDLLQRSSRNRPIPKVLKGIYDADSYRKQQAYHKENQGVKFWISTLRFVVIVSLLWFHGFAMIYQWGVLLTQNPILQTLLFFGVLGLFNGVFELPFTWYSTFRIETKYGFNTTTTKTFIGDIIKSTGFSVLLGGGLLALLHFLFLKLDEDFWWVAWSVITVIVLFLNRFYVSLFLPLFNKLTPLNDGELKGQIADVAQAGGFNLKGIFVMDGSKRSKKANAFFTGMGKHKTIVLYDTLMEQLTEKEICAVLAHEIGHYKKRHTLLHMLWSVCLSGVMLWLFSFVANKQELAMAMGMERAVFGISLVVFSLLFIPVNFLVSTVFNALSRRHEFQADCFAAHITSAVHLISALKKLASANYSNLTPHPYYVCVHYSHPPLVERINALNQHKSVQ